MNRIVSLLFLCVVGVLFFGTDAVFSQDAPSAGLPSRDPEGFIQERTSPFQGMEPGALQRMREDMTRELREISRVLGMIDPRDVQFAESMRTQQNTLIEQLKAVNAQLKSQGIEPPKTPEIPGAVASPKSGTPSTPSGPENAATPRLPENWRNLSPEELAKHFEQQDRNRFSATSETGTPGMPGMPGFQPGAPTRAVGTPFDTGGEKARQIRETARQLRELGLNELADQTLSQLNTPASGIIPESPVLEPRVPFMDVPPRPTVPGFAPNPASPWTPQPSAEIVELKSTVSSLEKKIDQLQNQVKALETQIQLLNQNILMKLNKEKE